jgi:hypothetical protein
VNQKIELPAGSKSVTLTLDKKPAAWAFEKSPATIQLVSFGTAWINTSIWTLTYVKSEPA